MLTTVVVDDHPVSLAFLDHTLRSAGLTPILASNADEAMLIAERQPVNIWFVDWVMPGMSGVDLVRAIRSGEGGDRSYVFMLTAKNTEEDLATAFEAGVDDFIRKPVGAMEFRARLSAAVRLATMTMDLSKRLTEIEELNCQLEAMASTDAMTSLLNRRAGMNRLQMMWAEAVRYNRPLSVSVIDIDNFKKINDAFGHARGDAAIRHVAGTLRDALRATDFVARIGGEEFLAVFPETSPDAAAAVLERCRANVAKARCTAEGKEIWMSISSGVAGIGPGMESCEELVRVADEALYAAKHAGRNQVVIAGVDASKAA